MEILNILVSAGLLYAICYVVVVITKAIVVFRVTNNKSRKLSNEAVKAVTKMMSHDINISFKK